MNDYDHLHAVGSEYEKKEGCRSIAPSLATEATLEKAAVPDYKDIEPELEEHRDSRLGGSWIRLGGSSIVERMSKTPVIRMSPHLY